MPGTIEPQRRLSAVSAPDDSRDLRVVIADDHPFYRAALARMLERHEIVVAAEVSNGEDAIRAVRETHPDVVLVDLNMPGTSGLETTRQLGDLSASTPVIVLSVSADEHDVTDAILAGATGYMLKDRPPAELVSGIRAAAAGQSPLSPRIAAMLIRRLRDAEDLDEEQIRRFVAGHAGARRPGHRLPRRW